MTRLIHSYEVPAWAPDDCGPNSVSCPVCCIEQKNSFWTSCRYDTSGDPLSELPHHPRGIIGALLANRLLDAGWLEARNSHVWGRLGDDGMYDLKTAYKIAFDAWTGLEA